MVQLSSSTKGMIICLVGVLVLTPDTLLIRAAGHVHPPTLLFYRYGFYGFTILSFVIAREGKQFFFNFIKIGWIGVLCGFTFGISNILFTIAVHYTAAANVLVILATNPLFSALFSWFLLGDVIQVRTAITMLVGLAAISLIFYDEFSGGSSPKVILGNIFACCTSVLMGLYFSMVKYFETTNISKISLIPCNAIAGFLVAAVAVGLGATPGSQEVWSMHSSLTLLFLIVQGIVVLPISFALLTIAPRYLSAPEVSLFMLIETCLGPLWVYLGGYEAPPPNTIIGGSVLIVALAIHSYLAIKEEGTIVLQQASTQSVRDVVSDYKQISFEMETCHEDKSVDLKHTNEEDVQI